MVATEHTSRRAANGRHPATDGGVDEGSAAERLVEEAAAFQVRAPEVTLVLGERAAAIAEAAGANDLWVRAESLVVHARVRLGHRASTVGRAVAALRAAEDARQPVVAAQLRTDLAVCARSVGAPLTGLAALRPVLTVGGLSSVQRVTALCHLVGCLGTLGRKAELDRVLMEGDGLLSADPVLDGDSRLLARAMLRVGVSAHRRRHGDLMGAADAARTGIGLLDDLEDASADGGLARVRLILELVCALLDRGDTGLAAEVAEPVLAEPQRAASAAPLGWLRLAMATRVHLTSGSAEAAARMLRDGVHSTDRYGLHALAARLWLELAHIEERIGEAAEAVECLRRSRAAEHLHNRARSQARALLTGEFGSGAQAPVDLADIVSASSPVSTPTPAAAPAPPTAPVQAVPVEESRTQPAASSTPSERRHTTEPRPRVVLPMLRLAPAQSDAGTPGGTQAAAPEPSSDIRTQPSARAVTREPDLGFASRLPGLTASTSSTDVERTGRPDDCADAPTSRSARKTRHDSRHGSVTARSVLDRLGISANGAGGRRRAADIADSAADTDSAANEEVRPHEGAPGDSARPEPSAATEPKPGQDDALSGLSDGYGWLPRLRLPPSLAPLGAVSADGSSSDPAPADDSAADSVETRRETTQHETESETSPLAETSAPAELAVPADEPPPDAGLAELLARALAEHRAGTSSASALVKRLGVDDDQPPRVNGRHRTDG